MSQAEAPPNILGISSSGHDPTAALLKHGELAAAIEEEKLVRVPRVSGLPTEAIRYCLQAGGVSPEQIDFVAIARPLSESSADWYPGESWIPKQLKLQFPSAKVIVLDHHLCHAAAAYFPSPFENAGILTLDENGDTKTGSLLLAHDSNLEPLEDSYFPDSLGNLFSRVTRLAGFTGTGGENKLQWLSAWGQPTYTPLLQQMVRTGENTLLNVDQSYFQAQRDDRGGFGDKFYQAAAFSPAQAISEPYQADLAASMQDVLERTVIDICCRLTSRGIKNLCLAGGVALNPLLIEKIENAGMFEGLFAQPAAGNAGNALGAALYCAHNMARMSRRFRLEHLHYGPQYSVSEIKDVLENCKLRFRYLRTRDEIVRAAVEILKQNQILGWFHGRTEFGPRALGNRSILASPLGLYVNENLNHYVKHREKFRPFAASVTEERAAEFFEFGPMARYLATVGRVKPQFKETFSANLLPARRTGDGESQSEPGRIRVHVVSRKTNPLFWDLLDAFGRATGVPVLFNTSFNLFGEPLVCSPRDAVRSFYCSGIDHLIIGNFLVNK